MENQQSERPRTVAIAVNLLWASIVVGLAKIPLDLPAMNLGKSWFQKK